MGRKKRRRTRGTTPEASPADASPTPPEPITKESPTDTPQAGGLPWTWLLAIFAVAVGLRLAVAEELRNVVLYQLPQLDAMEFLHWGQRIAAGDFTYPEYPTHGPAYPYLLGALLAFFDGSLRAVRATQALLGGVSCLLAAGIGARFWGRGAGLGAGLLLAIHGPLVMSETALWEEVVLTLALLTSLWAFTHPDRGPKMATLAGFALGVAALVRPTPLVLLPAFAVLIWLQAWRRRVLAIALLVLTTAALVTPAVVASSRAAGTFLFLRGFGAINLYIGNDPAGGGIQNARLGGAWDRLESAPFRDGITDVGDLEGYYSAKTFERIFDDPAGFVGVVLSKLVWLSQSEEPRDNHSYDFFVERSRVLAILPGFGLQLALAAVGAWVIWRRRRPVPWAVLLYGALMAATAVATLMGMRYRMPVVPALAIFGGLGAAALVDAVRAARRGAEGEMRRELLVLAAIAVAVLALSHLRHHPPTHVLAEEHALTGSSLQAAERLEEAEQAFLLATEEDPSSALGWDGLGRVHLRRGEIDDARKDLERAVEADPDFRRSHYHLAIALKQLGRTDETIDALRRAVEIGPRYLLALNELAPLELARGELDAARQTWEQALVVDANHGPALLGLARIAGAQGRPAEGVNYARRAAEATNGTDAWTLAGFLAIDARDVAALAAAIDQLDASGHEMAPPTRLLRASLFSLRGEHQQALEAARTLLLEQPGMQPAAQILLRSAEALGQRSRAEAFLRELWGQG